MISPNAILNSLEETVILLDKKARIISVNKAGEELFNRSFKEIAGMKLSQLLKGEKIVSPLLKETIKDGRSFRGKSINLEISAGQQINMDFNLSPFFVKDQIDGAVLSISRNINISEPDSDENDSVYYLLGSIAHEIKNPLGGIKGAAQLLRKNAQNAHIDEYVDLIIRETDRLNGILQDYLTICKKPFFHAINIHEIIEKALSLIDMPIRKKGIIVRRLYDPSLPSVRGDDLKLLQVFLNIIKNSLESMKKGGRIEISTHPSGELFKEQGKMRRMAVISIRDTGRGISEKDLQKIFVPFYTNKKQGTGIGLALSKRIIKDHRGIIKVKSQIRKGTTFSVYIPFDI